MNIDKIFREEDLFPREFANFEAREYGILFYDESNKDSYDSNHALIFREKIENPKTFDFPDIMICFSFLIICLSAYYYLYSKNNAMEF